MKTEGILTIDIGTSSVRVTLFDLDGARLDGAEQKVFSGASFDAEERVELVFTLMERVASRNPGVEVLRICPSTLISWVFARKDGSAAAGAYTFTHYCQEERDRFLEHFPEEAFYRSTGRTLSAELPLFKLAWLKKADRATYDAADWLLSFQGYIGLRLTGRAAMDRTFAAFTGLSDIRAGGWDPEIAQAAGVDVDKLPPQCGAVEIIGTLTPNLQRRLSIGPAQVVCGTSDGSAGALGSGVTVPGEGVDVMGTTDVFYALSDHPVFERGARLCVHPHPLPGLWLVGGATGLTGGAFDWAVNVLGEKHASFAEIDRQMEEIPPGSGGLKAVCAFSGERAPRWRTDIRGGLVGLGVEHTLAHCCRALSEAAGYLAREICELLAREGLPVQTVTAIGGGAKADTLLQLRSDILGCAVKTPEHLDATTRGCYALAALSLGRAPEEVPVNRERKRFQPRPEAVRTYDRLYEEYQAFYQRYAGFIKK